MDTFSPPLLEYAAIKELVATDQWICWRGEDDQGKPWIHGVSKNLRGDPDKPKKVPYRGNHKGHAKASSTGPSTWTTFAEACQKTITEETFTGVGFVLTDDDPYAGGDLDACRDPKTGKIDTWAQEIIDQLDTYTEVSPSGTGLRMIMHGKMPKGHRNKWAKIEFYSNKRYLTITGNHLEGSRESIEDRQDILAFLTTKPKAKLKDKKNPDAVESVQVSDEDLQKVIDEIAVVVEPDAEAPALKLRVLFENAPPVKATYTHTRKEPLWSPSEWDLALASYCANALWDNSEITRTLIAHRRENGYELKLRADYYARTIVRARSSMDQDDAMQAVLNSTKETAPEELMAGINHALFPDDDDCKIIEIIKFEGSEYVWRIRTTRGTVKGPGKMMMQYPLFSEAMLNATSIVIPRMSKDTWHGWKQKLADVSITERLEGEATDEGQAESWLLRYLYEAPRAEDQDAAAFAKDPFWKRGKLYVSIDSIKIWLRQSFAERPTSFELGRKMRQIGCITKPMSIKDPTGIAQTVTNNRWEVPKAMALQSGFKPPKGKFDIEDIPDE